MLHWKAKEPVFKLIGWFVNQKLIIWVCCLWIEGWFYSLTHVGIFGVFSVKIFCTDNNRGTAKMQVLLPKLLSFPVKPAQISKWHSLTWMQPTRMFCLELFWTSAVGYFGNSYKAFCICYHFPRLQWKIHNAYVQVTLYVYESKASCKEILVKKKSRSLIIVYNQLVFARVY